MPRKIRPAKPQRRRFTVGQVEVALRANLGNMRATASALQKTYDRPCSRSAVEYYIRSSPRLERVIKDMMEERNDIAEATVFTAMLKGDVHTARWYLARFASDRGYGPVGGEVVILDPSRLTVEQLLMLLDPARLRDDQIDAIVQFLSERFGDGGSMGASSGTGPIIENEPMALGAPEIEAEETAE